MKSWDRHQVPKPGSDVAIAIGAPIEVPGKADEADHRDAPDASSKRALARLEAQARA